MSEIRCCVQSPKSPKRVIHMKPGSVYLLVDGVEDGPHEPLAVLDRVEEGGLPLETLSCIEGMPGWRTLPETLIWSYSKLLPALPDARTWIDQMDKSTLQARDLSF